MLFLRRSLNVALAMGLSAFSFSSSSHVVLAEPAALAGTGYRAALRVGHGCDGAPTTALRVSIPSGLRGAKPMPKAGWVLSLKTGTLEQPYDDHGKKVTEGVTEITWTAASRDNWLPDAWYDEFVLRGTLQREAGAIWFKVLQTCATGSVNWAELPSTGTATDKLKTPAALLEIIPSDHVGHQH